MDGLTGGEASSFIKRLASGLAARWDKSYAYSDVLSSAWVRARLGFALVRATVLCLHSSWDAWVLRKVRQYRLWTIYN